MVHPETRKRDERFIPERDLGLPLGFVRDDGFDREKNEREGGRFEHETVQNSECNQEKNPIHDHRGCQSLVHDAGSISV
jgi:hypothetical protein